MKVKKETLRRRKLKKISRKRRKQKGGDPSDDDNETAEEWSWKGKEFYKLTKSNAVFDIDFEYVGIYDGKKIDRNAKMPASVKKYLEQFN